MRILELPIPLCPSGKIALAPLVHRDSEMAVRFSVWLGDDADFDGETPPETYNLLAAHDRFAHHGAVFTVYPADTFALDFELGLMVQLDGADTILDIPTSANGLSGELLVIVGNEIMSVVGATLIAAGLYRLFVQRGAYGTEPAEHDWGAEVFIVAKADLVALTHDRFEPGAELALKVPVEHASFKQELEAIGVVEYEVAGRAFDVSPSNLRVNGDQRNAMFTAGADVRVDWSLPESRWEIANTYGHKVRTLVEILAADDEEVIYSKLTAQQFFKIGGGKMTAILGGDTEFIVRLSTDVLANERITSTPITLNVKQA